MIQTLLLRVYPALLGLLVGSYLNVVIYRLPRGKSTVTPPSSCPRCGTRIKARDNIPILSFLLLRGRCRQCSEAIGWRYSIVEASTAALFVAVVATFGLGVEALIGAAFCCLLLILALIDLDHMILPDRLTLPGIVVGLLIHAASGVGGGTRGAAASRLSGGTRTPSGAPPVGPKTRGRTDDQVAGGLPASPGRRQVAGRAPGGPGARDPL